ncbi:MULTISPECIES: hypothetical protein [unclassified Streptomyces]|uniref:hypothetical protein n=1 Tax=unclassified Streptomyces TaxID=2593676 RepID=UPI00336A1C34
MANLILRLTEAEHEEIRRRAAAVGMTPQAYGRARLALDRDETREAFLAAFRDSLQRWRGEFEELNEELAARPRSTSKEMGFDPATRLKDVC